MRYNESVVFDCKTMRLDMNETQDSKLTGRDSVADILALIGRARRVVLSAHTYPDVDAVGSCLAMADFLRALGKEAVVALPKKDIGPVRALDGFADIVNPGDFDFATPPDLFVCLDCATVPRIALPELRGKTGLWRTLNIDHHETNERYGHLNYVVGGASSTGEVIYDIAKAAGWPLDRDVAEALWVAIVTDTGRFSYSATKPSTLLCAADLYARGVRVTWLNDELFSVFDRKVLDIQARALASLETWYGGKVAVISLSERDYAETGCTKSCTETFANIPRSVRGSVLAVFIYRLPGDPKTHFSIRARAPYSACALAKVFGGGGHELAAGATVEMPIDDAKAAVIAAAEAQLNS